jgi:predicted transcriptional regulator of viral defense system
VELGTINVMLGKLNQPVISDYELRLQIFKLYKEKKVQSRKKAYNCIKECVSELINNGVITHNKEFAESIVFNITGKKGYDSGDVACALDPFSYVSHISAMAFHGLTDRIPHVLYISTPPSRQWKVFASERMKKDLGEWAEEHENACLPKLKKIRIENISGKPVIQYSSIHQGAFKKTEDRSLRVSTIGRTFLDMVREQGYCGGIRHVVEVYTEHGGIYKRTIIDHVDRNGKSIEKARVGYLLEECCGVKDGKMDEWAKNVQRGSSKKLDPTSGYSPIYSERWCLSINV